MTNTYPMLKLTALLAVFAVVGDRCFAQRVDVEAYSGNPFGVGRITIHSGEGFRIKRVPRPGNGRIAALARRIADRVGQGDPVNLESAELSLVEKSGRALYPVFEKRDRPILRQFISVPTESTIFFLFRGDDPLDLTVYAPDALEGRVIPQADPAGHARLLRAWWNDYSSASDGRDAVREYPQIVEEYLTDTLARRLNLTLPRRTPRRELNILRGELRLLAGSETLRLEVAEAVLMGDLANEAATITLPEELPPPQPESLNPPADVPTEPLAGRVPVECFYVRFGSFPNFQWLRHRTEDWGGELRDVVSARGLDYGLNARMQQQLGLREGKLADIFGDKVIADVALIGTDMFLSEGAAIGTLFQAKSSAALSADLMQQRRSTMNEVEGAKEEKLTIADRRVSYISSPTGTVRSYYVVDGDYHLVTTSRQIVEWFLATADGHHESLAASEEFRYTRARMPLERNDTIFVYLSPEFFDNLLSGHYQIELYRRMRSAVEIELFPIAQLAARAEEKSATTIDELIAADMLPAGFGEHPDGSRLVEKDGQLVDSLRGGRGTFLPIPDVPLGKVTPSEEAEYRRFKDYYVEQWGQMDPVVVAIRREELPGGKLERVELEVQAAPLSPQHVETLSNWLGEPTDQRLAPVEGNVVSFEAVVRGGTFFAGGEHHLFGALRNVDPNFALDARTSIIARIIGSQLQGVQGYLGAWPEPGFLRLLGGSSNLPADPAGYTQLRTGLWRRQINGFTLLSFHPQILEQVSPELQFVKAERPAQVWLEADDLADSTLAPMINAFGYRQSRQITLGNTRFMNMLIEQLHVPPEESLATGERILGAKFMSPLGGEYELRKWEGGAEGWVATALADRDNSTQPPPDYQYEALRWVRGAKLELSMQQAPQAALAAHGEFIMPVESRPSTFELPKLPFGLSTPQPKPKADEKQPEVLPAPSGKREF
ncbi:MAG: hypothetical protein DWQ37_18915 [Planctomycetota bacterium]|nr:MAG: hypothetical protein DWQ37_18915 [Planctomycetota bacterium]